MSDVNYDVSINYTSNVAGLEAPNKAIDKLEARHKSASASILEGITKHAGAFNSMFDNAASAAASFGVKAGAAIAAGVTGALGLATREAFRFNEQMENTKSGLATIFNANGIGKEFGNSFRMAGEVIKEMQKDANKLPGTFEDLQKIMLTISAPGAQMGMGALQMEKMSAKAMSFSASANIPMAVAGRELAKMLDGSARHGMPFFDRLGVGMDAKAFNHLDSQKRLKLINSRLDAAAVGGGYAENNWETIRSTFKSKISQSLGTAGMPLFEGMKDLIAGKRQFGTYGADPMKDVTGHRRGGLLGEDGFIEKYTPALVQMGQKLSDFLTVGFEKAFTNGKIFFEHWFPLITGFGERLAGQLKAAFHQLHPFLDKVSHLAEKFLGQQAPLDNVKKYGAGLLAARVGTGMLEHGAGPIGSLMQAIGATGSMGAAGGSGALGTAGAAAPAVGVLAALAVAAAGVVSVLTDTSSLFHDFAHGVLKDIIAQGREYVEHVITIARNLQPLANLLGTGLLLALDMFLHLLNGVVWVVEKVTGAFNKLVNGTISTLKAMENSSFVQKFLHTLGFIGAAIELAGDKWMNAWNNLTNSISTGYETSAIGQAFSRFTMALDNASTKLSNWLGSIAGLNYGKAKLTDDEEGGSRQFAIERNSDYLPTALMTATAIAEVERKIEPPKNVTHIHNVEIKVNSNQDPSRVAKSVEKVLLDVAASPRTTRGNQNAAYQNAWVR